MPSDFSIEVEWEGLNQGPQEEKATFGAIGWYVQENCLTEAHDAFARRVRKNVFLSGYQMAQWLAWNWWRLLWEPRRTSPQWALAHRLSCIGGGYVWPNVDCITDGQRVLLQATPTPNRPAEPLQYVATAGGTVPRSVFEREIEGFIELVLEQLRSEGIRGTNLETIWNDVREERNTKEAAWFRHLEAAMGFDPDEGPRSEIETLIQDAPTLGKDGVEELAGELAAAKGCLPKASQLRAWAQDTGHLLARKDMPRLSKETETKSRATAPCPPAWTVGEEAARVFRRQEHLGMEPLSNAELAGLAAAKPEILTAPGGSAPFSYALDEGKKEARLVLTSSFPTGRRFALARFIGDHLIQNHEPLTPILRSNSYRQKVQRAFAAELLCPFEEVKRRLDEDYSEEKQEQVAADFQVSPMVVCTQLVNKGLLVRETLQDF